MTQILRKTIFISIVSIFIIGSIFLFSRNGNGYDDQTTHPGITDEIVDFYNLSFDDKLSAQEKEWIVQGSIDEDTPPRWINHFYDPTNGDGWKSENLGGVSSSTLKIFTRIFLNSNTEIVSSKNWIHNESLQLKYANYGGNRTWENAIRRYASGDKEYAYKTLGHILHLLEDKTVPDHTRNDTHAHEGDAVTKDGGSPYEDYGKNWNRWNLTTAQDLKKENKSPVILGSIDGYLDYLANYSNKYFFSEHTINSEKYNGPIILREKTKNNLLIGYGKDKNGEELPLTKIEITYNDELGEIKSYSLRDNDNLILSSYFSRLSREAVMSGAGAIKLFKEETAKAEKDNSLIPEEPKISWWQQMRSPLYGAIIPAYNSATSVFNSVQNIFSQSQPIGPMASVANIGSQLNNLTKNTNQQNQSDIEAEISNQESVEQNMEQKDQNQEFEKQNQDSGEEIASSLAKIKTDGVLATQRSQQEIIHAPYQSGAERAKNNTEIIHAPWQGNVGQQNQGFAGQNQESGNKNQWPAMANNGQPDISGGGVESPNQESGIADQEENNQIQESVEQEEYLSDGQNQESEEDQEVETQPEYTEETGEEMAPPVLPDINLYLTDYNVREFDFTLNWEDKNGVVDNWELQYKLGLNFEWDVLCGIDAEECGTNAENQSLYNHAFIAKYDDLTYYFRLRGQDADSNFTDWQTLNVDISTKPVVINEVAWMGTTTSHNNEWIELANKTDQEIDLAGWKIKSQEGSPNINITLAGKITPKGYYLLERTNDDSVLGIAADQIYTGVLTNSNQQLTLSDGDNNEMDKVATDHAGNNTTKQTAERVSVWSVGIEQTNWKTSQDVLGTPKAKNSQADLYSAMLYSSNSYPIIRDTVFLKDRGPYIAKGYPVTVGSQATLIIEPGTILKFEGYGRMEIKGKLIAKGATQEKIIFTSLKDDQYGGDTNSDSNATIAVKGDWMNLSFAENSAGEMENIIARYGVNIWTKNGVNNWAKSMVYVGKSANVKVGNSVFENSGGDGLAIDNYLNENPSKINLSGNEFKNNTGRGVAIAYVGDADISDNVFENNSEAGVWLGTVAGGPTAFGDISISNNSFIGNKAPIQTEKLADFNINGNSVSNNTHNGVYVYGSADVTESKDSITLYSDIPFVVDGNIYVGASKTLNVSPGVVFKIKSMAHISGTLNAVGTSENPIVFTTIADDQYGGDSNNDGNATMPNEKSWYWMQFVSGGGNSILDNVVVRYAGRLSYSMGGPPSGGSGIYVESGVSNFVFKNSRVDNSVIGADIQSDGAIIENSFFASNSDTGLKITADNATVSNVTFDDNQVAFQSSSPYMATILLSNLIFNGNNYNYWPEDLISL